MTTISGPPADRTRNRPISETLRDLLIAAGSQTGIDSIFVTSGGQCALGECDRRTGSTRHDNGQAADLHLIKGGSRLNFTRASDLPTIKAFVSATARLGATGIGAGLSYMGAETFHIGFGKRAVWGGTGANAAPPPAWLVEAVRAGWSDASSALAGLPEAKWKADDSDDLLLQSDEDEVEDIAESVGDAAPPVID